MDHPHAIPDPAGTWGPLAEPVATTLDGALRENATLARQLAAAQARLTSMQARHARQVERLEAEAMRQRGRLMAGELALAVVRDELAELEAAIPALPARKELIRRTQELTGRVHALERECLRWQQAAQREAERARLAEQARVEQAGADVAAMLRDKSVLCVGAGLATVQVYRRLTELTGARFLHHDAGAPEDDEGLERHLAAADLVICQTGCLSHGAWWRVQDHCRRTGKRCVLAPQDSASGFARSLREAAEPAR